MNVSEFCEECRHYDERSLCQVGAALMVKHSLTDGFTCPKREEKGSDERFADGYLLCNPCEYVTLTGCSKGIARWHDERGYYCHHRQERNDTVTNELGAKQSRLDHEWLDFDANVLLRLSAISAKGKAKYGPGNWRNIAHDDHINHALTHIMKHRAGDTSEDHLGNAACRLLFALATEGK